MPPEHPPIVAFFPPRSEPVVPFVPPVDTNPGGPVFRGLKSRYAQASPQIMAVEKVDFLVDVSPRRHEGGGAERAP